jgi:hypothetical protein
VKERETVEAAAKLALPAWEAVMVQVPAATSVSVVPLLPVVVQMEVVDEEKETVRPEDAVAERGSTLIPKVLLAREAKVMAWVAVVMVSVAVIVAVS